MAQSRIDLVALCMPFAELVDRGPGLIGHCHCATAGGAFTCQHQAIDWVRLHVPACIWLEPPSLIGAMWMGPLEIGKVVVNLYLYECAQFIYIVLSKTYTLLTSAKPCNQLG